MDKDKEQLFIGHLAQNEGWEPREIAAFLKLDTYTVEKVLAAFKMARLRAREPEVDLALICPKLFHDA